MRNTLRLSGAALPALQEITMMRFQRHARAILVTVFASLVMLGGTAHAKDVAYRVIHNFHGWPNDGCEPVGVPAPTRNGDVYGVTSACGAYEYYGTAFKLTAPRTRGGAWRETILYNFPGGSGGFGADAIVLGADGNLYGFAGQVVFELKAPTGRRGVWKYTSLYTLNGTTQGDAIQGIALDAKGNIYGATEEGGDLSCGNGHGCGIVFELKRPTKDGGKWRLSVLHTFPGQPDGEVPFAGVTFDQMGNLYGTTDGGGTYGYGTVYRLSPPAQKGGSWTETVLYSFDPGTLGDLPGGPVTFDESGNMYGTTVFGGDLNCSGGFGCGVVFELSPQQRGTWTYTNLYSFQGGGDGAYPKGHIVMDSKGDLYSTTTAGGGGQGYSGTAFKLTPPPQKGDAWTETVLHSFKVPEDTGANGGLTWGKWGDLYGVTYLGGTGCPGNGCGTVFELQP